MWCLQPRSLLRLHLRRHVCLRLTPHTSHTHILHTHTPAVTCPRAHAGSSTSRSRLGQICKSSRSTELQSRGSRRRLRAARARAAARTACAHTSTPIASSAACSRRPPSARAPAVATRAAPARGKAPPLARPQRATATSWVQGRGLWRGRRWKSTRAAPAAPGESGVGGLAWRGRARASWPRTGPHWTVGGASG